MCLIINEVSCHALSNVLASSDSALHRRICCSPTRLLASFLLLIDKARAWSTLLFCMQYWRSCSLRLLQLLRTKFRRSLDGVHALHW